MLKLSFLTGIFLIAVLPSLAQDEEPVPAPADVVLEIKIDSAANEFHLGELIPVKYSYSAKTPDRYFWVSQSSKLSGGHSVSFSCSPAAESVSENLRSSDDLMFEEMLNAPCGGVGRGIGGGLGSEFEQTLGTSPLSFGFVPLNTYLRFRKPGTYTCEAYSADVTSTLRDEKIRPALLVKSNPVILTVVDEPAWARTASHAYGSAYANACTRNDVVEKHFLQCSDLARRITYLDTADSLAMEVKWFDGKEHGWDNGFWKAIQNSSQPEEAVRLMASRIQEHDFRVTKDVLEWLATSELRSEVPDAFQIDSPETYHEEAVEKIRKYVRLLGSSLSSKYWDVLTESARTYRVFSAQNYCAEGPLIPTEEQKQALAGWSEYSTATVPADSR